MKVGIDLIRPIHRDVQGPLALFREKGDFQLPGQFRGFPRRGHAVYPEPGLHAFAEGQKKIFHGGAGPQAHERPVLDEVQGGFTGRAFTGFLLIGRLAETASWMAYESAPMLAATDAAPSRAVLSFRMTWTGIDESSRLYRPLLMNAWEKR